MRTSLRRAGGLCGVLVLLFSLCATPAYADSLHTVDVWGVIHRDGSVDITELVELTMTEAGNTEFYMAKHNLDNMEIQHLVIEEIDDTGAVIARFETLDTWPTGASREEKAYRCGLVTAGGGYEVCFGFGELGRHRYRITYTLTNMVKGYAGGDAAMSHNFLSEAAGGADRVNIHLSGEGFDLVYPDTRVWVFGYEAESAFLADGTISVLGQGGFSEQDYAVVMLAFSPGILDPIDQRHEPVDSFINDNLVGSHFPDDEESGSSVFLRYSLPILIQILILVGGIALIFRCVNRRRGGAMRESRRKASAYNQADYCRELPFRGDLPAAYARLYDLTQVEEGAIIGCYLLKWIREGHVELAGDGAIVLQPAAPDMHRIEAWLYHMILSAAGNDGKLQSKEFETWAWKNHGAVGSWLRACRQHGRSILNDMGACHEVQVSLLFGLLHTPQSKVTPQGDQMTMEMFGFKRYLMDFTVINEREAMEVELWDQYLIFARLFGIADSVAAQFRQLYPGYFERTGSDDQHRPETAPDIVGVVAVSESFARSMHSGYRSGARSSSSSGGGGGASSSSGGGGRSSGGGGAGGR